MDNIDLELFINSEVLLLRQFFRYWKNGNTRNPEHYPLNMPIAEWREQFEFFLGIEKKDAEP